MISRARFIPQIVAILMLLWALNPENPYGYYVLLRIVLCGVCTFLAYHALKIGNDTWAWILGVTAVLYNPIIPVHLTRETWSAVNIATVVVLAATVGALRKRSLPEQPLIRCPVGFSGDYPIPDGVTSIGDRAFSVTVSLTSVTIPDSVISIGDVAFYECSALTSVTIPASVTSIGDAAFYNCTSLTSITIPASVTRMGMHAFSGCTALTSVTFIGRYSSHYIGLYAFSGCTALTSVIIPDSVTGIRPHAFHGCTALTSVIISGGVTHIGNHAFAGCTSLASVTIPGGVTSIEKGTFYECSALASVTIPGGVTSIGNHAFHGCTALTSVIIPDGVTSIGDAAFSRCSALTSIINGKGVTSIGNHAFHGCTALTSVIIPDGVTSIGEAAFSGCSALTSVTIPASVTSIGNQAFFRCSVLTSVSIPAGVTTIGENAFYGCPALASVFFTGDAPNFFVDAFTLTPATIYYLPGTSGWGATYDGRPAKPLFTTYAQKNGGIKITGTDTSFTGKFLTIPESLAGRPVTSIGDSAFRNRRSLVTVTTIPASVTSIDDRAFAGCSALASISIPDSVISIGDRAFAGCSALDSVTIPASVTSIGDEAFVSCSALTSVTIPANVTAIGSRVFCRCTALTSVTIPANVRAIDSSAFSGCTSLASILFNGDAPTVFSNNADDIPVAFPRAFFNTRAKIYFRPGTSGWGAKPKEKMIFQSEDEFEAYADKHPDETFCWVMGEVYEIVPGEAAPATETATLEPAAKQEATPTEEGWKTSQAAKEPDTVPGATTAERVAAALEANPERAERAREEASGNAEASSEEVNAARVKETDIDTGEVRYRLSRDIELGLVTPDTSLSLSPFILTVHGKIWDREFGGLAHNPDQLAAHILSMPAEIAAARIMVADAIVKHLAANPAHRFHPGEGYVSMGSAMREAFQSRWFRCEKSRVFRR